MARKCREKIWNVFLSMAMRCRSHWNHWFSQCKKREQKNPGDGLDNDCDGVIDEEVFDLKDNDGDGRVDEDLEVVSFLAVVIWGSWSIIRNSLTLLARTTKNTDWSTGPLARPFACSLALLTRSLAPDCSLCSRPPLCSRVHSLAHFAHSLARGTVND